MSGSPIGSPCAMRGGIACCCGSIGAGAGAEAAAGGAGPLLLLLTLPPAPNWYVKAVGTALGILWCWRIIEIVRPPEPPEVVTGAASKAFWSSAWFFKFACDGEKCRPPWNEPLLWRRFACMLASGDVGTWTGAMWECTE